MAEQGGGKALLSREWQRQSKAWHSIGRAEQDNGEQSQAERRLSKEKLSMAWRSKGNDWQ